MDLTKILFIPIMGSALFLRYCDCAISGSIVEKCDSRGVYDMEVFFTQDGSAATGNCSCPDWIGDRCCQVLERLQAKLPTCNPGCLNEGVCFTNDTCQCVNGFFGPRCERGGDMEERLKPRLNPTLPLRDLYQPLSWYDGPEAAWDNRACYVKVSMENSPDDVIITAVSTKIDVISATFGNFTAGPMDADGKINGSFRFACLEVRCPSANISGDAFDVTVDVSLESAFGPCHISEHASISGFKKEAAADAGNSDKGRFVLHYGNNYGSKFGVYAVNGYLTNALYLSRQKCYSGSEFDVTNVNVTRGAAVTYAC
ncbi:uncharacterized protein LOC127858339 [Dreissena polymorpha]|nr:uncharacterized protein LOC127858339 [Dreissena polymorpha]